MNKKIAFLFLIIFSSLGHLWAQQSRLDKGLIARFPFNATAEDLSGNGNHGTERGGLSYGVDRFGNGCSALEFNGRNAYVSVPDSRSLSSPVDELTVSVWFKLDPGATDLKWLTVCCKSDLTAETSLSPQYRMQATRVTLSVNTEFTENLDKDINFDTWYHYVMVYDGYFVKAYLDGQRYFEYPYSQRFVPNNMPLEIGRDMPGVIEYFSGTLDDLRIYSRGLSDQEVMALYQDNSDSNPPPCPGISPPPATAPVNTTPPAATPLQPPIVDITNPSSNPHKSNTATTEIQATIEHVNSKNDVTFRVNGVPSSDFKFSPRRKQFLSTVQLVQGSNIFEIIAVNKDGKDDGSTIIQYQPPAPPPVTLPQKNPPQVIVKTPGRSPHRAGAANQTITAEVLHVHSKNNIRFKFNGVPITQFTFNSRTKAFRAQVDLTNGNNFFEIEAMNKDGEDQASGMIQWEKKRTQVAVNPPKITIINPAQMPHQSSDAQQPISAIIDHIQSARDIVFKFNGQGSTAFKFDPKTKFFESTLPLLEGNNIFEITAINQDGQDSDTGVVFYTSPTPPAPPKPEDFNVGEVNIIKEIFVSSPNVEMTCYDHKKEDGDVVSIIFDDELLVSKVELKARGNGEINQPLPQLTPNKDHIIISKAWNLGKVPPNTMTMEIRDGVGPPQKIVVESKIGESGAIKLRLRQ